jgi:tRNA (cytidine/uridine-2'-O-)-methyltransferase
MRIALYQPDIPQNTGTLLRLAACLGLGVDIIEPCGFILSDRRMRRAGMDYLDAVEMQRHSSWQAFQKTLINKRLILLSPHAQGFYHNFEFHEQDIIMVGQESIGVPPQIYAATDVQLQIPMQKNYRSLNVALATAMVVGEALRQTNGFNIN